MKLLLHRVDLQRDETIAILRKVIILHAAIGVMICSLSFFVCRCHAITENSYFQSFFRDDTFFLILLQDGVRSLLGHVFGDKSLPESVRGDTVTESNMMTYLGMIEEKTNQLLQVKGKKKIQEFLFLLASTDPSIIF